MQTKPKNIIVPLPDNSHLNVSYYLSDKRLKDKEKENLIDLIVQLSDCHCYYRIDKEKVKNVKLLEALVHKTVINTKGHFC